MDIESPESRPEIAIQGTPSQDELACPGSILSNSLCQNAPPLSSLAPACDQRRGQHGPIVDFDTVF